MLKYIVASGIAGSVLFVSSDIGINAFGNMLKIKKETGVPIKIQLMRLIKKRQVQNSNLFFIF